MRLLMLRTMPGFERKLSEQVQKDMCCACSQMNAFKHTPVLHLQIEQRQILLQGL